ncbi:hypothetical protein ACWEOI_19730 [Nocardia sp. NPDC004340]
MPAPFAIPPCGIVAFGGAGDLAQPSEARGPNGFRVTVGHLEPGPNAGATL